MWLTQPSYTADELAGIEVPMLILQGKSDDLVRPDHAESMANAIPNAKLTLLPGMGDFAPIEYPAAWNRSRQSFRRTNDN